MSLDNNYIAIIGDVVKSKSIDNRAEVQQMLNKILNEINYKYQETIVSKFLITLGDEFQGLLKPTKEIYGIILDIVEAMEPVQIRFGVGYGSISTDINTVALGMDGTSFYHARNAIEKAHDRKGHSVVFSSEFPDLEYFDLAINTILLLLSNVRNLLTDRQKIIFRCVRLGLQQEEIASELRISQSAVSQAVNRSRIMEIREAEQNLKKILDQILEYKHSAYNN